MMTLTTEQNNDMKSEKGALFSVVHPLDDSPEQKIDTENLAPMQMTRTVRVCLFALRGYLALMLVLLGFRVLQLAGMIRS